MTRQFDYGGKTRQQEAEDSIRALSFAMVVFFVFSAFMVGFVIAAWIGVI